MHDLTKTHADPGPTDDDVPSRDQRHETRMAWIASLWAAMAVLATAIAIWGHWHVVP